jgi:RNA recognition motif-containing protein
MATQEEGEAAVKAMDGKELDGRELRVNEARPKEQ